MPTQIEQIDKNGNLVVDYDVLLSNKQKEDILLKAVDGSQIKRGKFVSKVLCYKDKIVLFKQLTYLGNPHPHNKKRIQIPSTWANEHEYWTDRGFDVSFVGIYAFGDNIKFVIFDPTGYVGRSVNNSSAHVYTSHIYQATVTGYAKWFDKNHNCIEAMDKNHFLERLGAVGKTELNPEIKVFADFSKTFLSTNPLFATDAVKEMFNSQKPDFIDQEDWKGYWPDTFFGEWQGAYTEFKLAHYLQDNNLRHIVDLVKQKKTCELDLDLKFSDFWGDVKTSNVYRTEAPLNDQEAVKTAVNECGKFWVVLFGIQTCDSPKKSNDFRELEKWNLWKRDVGYDNGKSFKIHSYASRFKPYVEYVDMKILEINKINMNYVLHDFNQGHQPDGSHRKPKYKINKKEMEVFTIFSNSLFL